MSTATTTPIDYTKSAKELASEATKSVTITVNVNSLLLEEVLAYKLRDVLPFAPANKREGIKQAKIEDMVRKLFEQTKKSMEQSAAVKMARATHPELFRA